MNTCKHCSKPLIGKWQISFCSKSCATSEHNKEFKKKFGSLYGRWCKCGKNKSPHAKQCQGCRSLDDFKKFHNKALFEVELKEFGSLRWKRVREWAKRIMILNGIEKKCFSCGWFYHIEVCHKKPIGKFSKDTKVSIVNGKENLVYLCPNCHWILDNKPELLASSNIG